MMDQLERNSSKMSESAEPQDHSDMKRGTTSKKRTTSQKKPDIDESTLARLRNTAENGNKDSLYFLGLFYYYGNGVQRSRSKAVEYFTEAAK